MMDAKTCKNEQCERHVSRVIERTAGALGFDAHCIRLCMTQQVTRDKPLCIESCNGGEQENQFNFEYGRYLVIMLCAVLSLVYSYIARSYKQS